MALLCVSKLFPAFFFFLAGVRGMGGGWVSTLLLFFPFILGSHVFRTINDKVPFLNLEYTDLAVLVSWISFSIIPDSTSQPYFCLLLFGTLNHVMFHLL